MVGENRGNLRLSKRRRVKKNKAKLTDADEVCKKYTFWLAVCFTEGTVNSSGFLADGPVAKHLWHLTLSPLAHLHVMGTLRFMSDINQPSLPTPFYSVLVSIRIFMALSTVFHSTNSPDNSPFSHSVLVALAVPYWSFQLYMYIFFLWKSPSALI